MSPHPATLSDDDLVRLCVWATSRGSGPGGQRRNKVETGASCTHTPTGLSAQATERRSHAENRKVALRRLRLILATEFRAAVPVPHGLDEVASELWRSRRKNQRLSCNPSHRDYPALLAEALDVASDSAWDVRTTALRLGVTPSQVLKLVRAHPPALLAWNARREQKKKPPLK